MRLSEIIPDGDVLLSMDPEELGLRSLPYLSEVARRSNGILSSGTFVEAVIGYSANPSYPNQYPASDSRQIERALREAFAWLEGAALLVQRDNANMSYRALSRKAERLASASNPLAIHAPRVLPRDRLHPAIRDDVWGLFHQGKFDIAVFVSMKAVEVAVREASGFGNDLIGTKLMSAAFKDGGPLTDPSVEPAEQVARMNLFAGSIGSYKNSHSHRNVTLDDVDEAAEIIILASHLLRIVEARRAAKAGP